MFLAKECETFGFGFIQELFERFSVRESERQELVTDFESLRTVLANLQY